MQLIPISLRMSQSKDCLTQLKGFQQFKAFLFLMIAHQVF
jgi:hypothetical protein